MSGLKMVLLKGMFKLPDDNFILLETNRFDKDNQRSYLFSNPVKVIASYNPEDIKKNLFEVVEVFSRTVENSTGFKKRCPGRK